MKRFMKSKLVTPLLLLSINPVPMGQLDDQPVMFLIFENILKHVCTRTDGIHVCTCVFIHPSVCTCVFNTPSPP